MSFLLQRKQNSSTRLTEAVLISTSLLALATADGYNEINVYQSINRSAAEI